MSTPDGVERSGSTRRFRRAARLELLGRASDSGFAEAQWLVERDGRFVQLPEPLYRVLEQLGTSADPAELAEAVSREAPWKMTAEQAEHLLATKLVPAGLVEADGQERAAPARAPSLLQVGARMKLMGPRLVGPAARTLRFLHAPPLLIPLLAAIGAAHFAMYATGASERAILAVLREPTLVGVAFALIVVGGFFHELGHASGLVYGGGRVRAMGVGFYLIYPAFYTDTSDAYRLGRWARVRVDLGGFYFHQLFAALITAVSLATGLDALLLVALVIDLEMLRQLLFPFLRLDGYWLLSDLTGVPDLFTVVRPFLRGLLRPHQLPRLPPLKRWVAATLAVYAGVAIPMLGLLLYLFASRAPGYVAVAWDSWQTDLDKLQQALDTGSPFAAFVTVVELGILLLPVVGTAYMVSVVARIVLAVRKRTALTRDGVRLGEDGATAETWFVQVSVPRRSAVTAWHTVASASNPAAAARMAQVATRVPCAGVAVVGRVVSSADLAAGERYLASLEMDTAEFAEYGRELQLRARVSEPKSGPELPARASEPEPTRVAEAN
ncbi:MAG: hypothetical protein ABR583_14810 [Gaiellaceae bacterium]